jgi:hypothetical protein
VFAGCLDGLISRPPLPISCLFTFRCTFEEDEILVGWFKRGRVILKEVSGLHFESAHVSDVAVK